MTKSAEGPTGSVKQSAIKQILKRRQLQSDGELIIVEIFELRSKFVNLLNASINHRKLRQFSVLLLRKLRTRMERNAQTNQCHDENGCKKKVSND